MTITNAQILDRFGVTAEIEADMLAEFIPTITTLARQGDVLIVRRDKLTPATTLIPAAGVTVVRSEARQGNTHMLHALTGDCFYNPDAAPDKASMVVYGVLTVPAGSQAVLVHTGEHGAVSIDPGTYQIRGQVEGATVLRRVTD